MLHLERGYAKNEVGVTINYYKLCLAFGYMPSVFVGCIILYYYVP